MNKLTSLSPFFYFSHQRSRNLIDKPKLIYIFSGINFEFLIQIGSSSSSGENIKVLHRKNLPASIGDTTGLSWYKRGRFHNIKGPAYISIEGCASYYLDGKKFTEEDWEKERRKPSE